MQSKMEDFLERLEGHWLVFGGLVVIPLIVAFGAFGLYRMLDMGLLGVIPTFIILVNTALTMFFIAHAAPLAFLSSRTAALALNAYGASMPLLVALLAGYGFYLAFIK